MTATRTVNASVTTESIVPQDDKGQVKYNSTNPTTVYLQAGSPSIGLDVASKGSGTVTFYPLNGATINGSTTPFPLTQNTSYRLWTSGTDGKNPADWYIK